MYTKYADGNSFAYSVGDINSFALQVNFPPISDWDNSGLQSKLQDRLHDDTVRLIRASEFYAESHIRHSRYSDHFALEYGDDINDFKISVYQDRLLIQKTGGRMENFHRWYFSAAPGFSVLVNSMLELMSKLLQRDIIPTSVGYKFGFILHDFLKDGEVKKNYEVLQRLVTKLPGLNGGIVDVSSGDVMVSRTDYKVSVWDGNMTSDRRLLSYSAEAPANSGYSGLWFSFSYGSETYTNPQTGEREWSAPNVLLDEHERVYQFIWSKGLEGFVKSILGGLDFKTTATYIP